MQKRALNAKDAKRIKKQYSDICVDSALRQHYAEKEHQRGLKVRAFESQCLKDMIESFEQNFNQPEHAEFFNAALEQISSWVNNKYTQNFVGALLQLKNIAVRCQPSSLEKLERWSERQRWKHEYAIRLAEKNNFGEGTKE